MTNITPATLRITGAQRGPCVLGGPIHLYDGDILVGTLDPVPVSRDGTEVHIEHFKAHNMPGPQRHQFGKLALLEMMDFICKHFSTVQVISFSLARPIEGDDGTSLAGARAAVLESIGTSNIVIAPKPMAGLAGHFVVTGLWEYNPLNVAALDEALAHERKAYAARAAESAAAGRGSAGKESWLRRLFSGAGKGRS